MRTRKQENAHPLLSNRYYTFIAGIPKTKTREEEPRNKKNHIIGRSTIYTRTFIFAFQFITIDSLLIFALARVFRIHNALSLYTMLSQYHPSFCLLQYTSYTTNFLMLTSSHPTPHPIDQSNGFHPHSPNFSSHFHLH